jgi:hypothetical protein
MICSTDKWTSLTGFIHIKQTCGKMHSTITNMAVYNLAYKTYINDINEHISVPLYVTVNITYLAKGIESCIYLITHI